MQALQLAHAMRTHPYACRSLTVTPNPPEVGHPTTIALALNNAGPEPITVNRIALRVSNFGMGVAWEELPPIGPLHVPADPNAITEVKVEWTPTRGGHRCVRGSIDIEGKPQPLWVGLNLSVIQSAAEKRAWQIPFMLGNPTNERQPVVLRMEGSDPAEVGAYLVVGNRRLRPEEPVWLDAYEEVEARLRLFARSFGELKSVHAVEAYIGSRLIDGIQVVVERPAVPSVDAPPEPAASLSRDASFALVG